MAHNPFPHQWTGAQFLAPRYAALLADDPGLGKTLQTVLAADLRQANRVCVLCKNGPVKEHWNREFTGNQRIARPWEVLPATPKQIPRDKSVVVSHVSVTKPDVAFALAAAGPWDLLIVDESDEFRNPQAQKTMNVFSDLPHSLWKYSRAVWTLTGTPQVNSAADYFFLANSIFRPGFPAMAWNDFVRMFTDPVMDSFTGELKPKGVKNADYLHRLLSPFMLRRTEADCGIDLPELRVANFPLQVSDRDLRPILAELIGWNPSYMTEEMLETLDPESEAMSRVRRALGVAKINPACDYATHLMETGAGPLVLFFHHHDVGDGVFNRLSNRFRMGRIDRTANETKRLSYVDAFQRGELDILLVQTQAGGSGLTLTRSRRALVLESPWTATALYQAIKRVHRISQTEKVLAEVLFAQGCWLEELMARVVTRKAADARSVLQR